MYKHISKEDWERILQLPHNYSVDALVVVGIANREKELEFFKNILFQQNSVEEKQNIKDSFFKNIFEFTLNGKTIWFDIVYGGAYLSELAHIACLFGSKKNFLLGSCGGLQDNLKTGDIIIPTYTYGDESITRMYGRDAKDNKHYPNKELSEEILGKIDGKYTVHTGPVVTCQAMLGETQEDVEQWKKEGYLGVEMESSTLFSISSNFNVPSTALLHVSDNLVKNELVGGDIHTASKQLREEIKKHKYQIVIENLLNS